jgi:3-oxoacyl-[acyl-carrier protein] reductase
MKMVISGGSSGIGLAIARNYSARGDSQVFVVDRSEPPPPAEGIKYVSADVTYQAALQSAFAKIGPAIDILISNAGVIRRGALFASSPDDFDILFDVNVKGSWLFVREALPFLAANATIMQMSSGHALDPPDDPGVYALTKMCLANFVQLLRRHYGQFQIKAAYPGPVETPLAVYGLNAQEIADKKSIMHSPEYVATHIVQLLESPDCHDLLFNGDKWDYELTREGRSCSTVEAAPSLR